MAVEDIPIEGVENKVCMETKAIDFYNSIDDLLFVTDKFVAPHAIERLI